MPPRVRKRVLRPPPGKYSVIEGCQVVALRHLSTSASVISQNGFIAGTPSISCSPVPSSAAGPELIRWRMPSWTSGWENALPLASSMALELQ